MSKIAAASLAIMKLLIAIVAATALGSSAPPAAARPGRSR
jgi:hypothetical protein